MHKKILIVKKEVPFGCFWNHGIIRNSVKHPAESHILAYAIPAK